MTIPAPPPRRLAHELPPVMPLALGTKVWPQDHEVSCTTAEALQEHLKDHPFKFKVHYLGMDNRGRLRYWLAYDADAPR